MDTVTVSSKYQIVIPRNIRTQMKISPGMKLVAINVDGRIELIPIRPVGELKGFLAGCDPTFEREEDRI